MGIGYVRSEDLSRWVSGSYEEIMYNVARSITEAVGDPVDVIATRQSGALFLVPDGKLFEATFGDDGAVHVAESEIRQYKDADVPVLVAEELRTVVSSMVAGDAVDAARIGALIPLLKPEEDYWLSDIISSLDESLDDESEGSWHTLYLANQEKIRTSLWGSIREIEGKVPKTSYSKIQTGRLSEFNSELRESLAIINGVFVDIVDTTAGLQFHDDDELFFGAIRDSLIAEARLLNGLLAKAEKLMREEDIERIAVAHDRLAGRAKTMGVVSAYIKGRAKKAAED